MTELTSQNREKVLIVRMLGSADVCAIGLPSIRFFQKKLPNAELHFLTYGDGGTFIRLAEPNVQIHVVEKHEWPDDFFKAMEFFLGLAEKIISHEFTQIVNLDTVFMPCFLMRFLKDAGEPVSGNFLNMSVHQLISKVQDQSLKADYVNSAVEYMDSTFINMHRFHGQWWQMEAPPDGGYPEFYLRQCCGFTIDDLEQDISVLPDKRLKKKAKNSKVIGLCMEQSEDGYLYPFATELGKLLEQKGYSVWQSGESHKKPESILKMLAASDLMICKASGLRWLAQSVNCPTLLISGDSEPTILMPEFATDPVSRCLKHGATGNPIVVTNDKCNCDKPSDLIESVESIFQYIEQEQANA